MVSEEMIQDALANPWYTDFMQKRGDRPTVIVGTIRNKTSEHIPTATFVGDIERAFVNSARVRVVATAAERVELRDERADHHRVDGQPGRTGHQRGHQDRRQPVPLVADHSCCHNPWNGTCEGREHGNERFSA